MIERRRFPPPRTIGDNGACYIIRDKNGQALSYVYYGNEPGRRAAANFTDARRSAKDRSQRRQAAGATWCF